MTIPKLQRSDRRREYDLYSSLLRSKVVHSWLFSNKTHRQIDEEILGLDSDYSRGYQSMGILHFLGLTASFHSLFINTPEALAIDMLQADQQDFTAIISLLAMNQGVAILKRL
ncbi:MAG: hypothetical protein PHQ41_07805 [Candidatus Cloacimonetes bacterium]|nr:hypothetical protein [Candidatus Cloacimonadota bacterium]